MHHLSKRAALGGSAAMAAALLAGSAVAQDDGSGFLGTILLGESKREVQTDTATPVTVIDQREIDDRQAGTIAELIDSVPGVNLVNGSTPQGSGINIRGYGANGTYGTDQKVAVQVDGASVGAEELYRIGTQLFTDPELYREAEVIRGTVGSFEYGSGIVGGVVRLETKDASDFTGGEPGLKFRQTLQYSSNGDGLLSSSILAWQPTEQLEFLANYTYRTQDDQKDGDGTIIGNSAFDLPSYLLKGRYSFGAGNAHSLTLSFSDTSTSERDVPYDTFGTTGGSFGNVDRDVDSQVAVLAYNFNPEGNDLVDLDVILSYANQEIDQEYVAGSSTCEGGPPFPCGFPVPPTGFDVVNADQQYETTKLTVKNSAYFSTGRVAHDLRTGVELIQRDRLDANSAPGGTDDRIAVFAVDDISLGGWTVTPAFRYERSKIDGSTAPNDADYENDAAMGGLSLRYEFDNGIALFGSAAYTESLPIIDDLGNAALMNQSEKARTYELGASYFGQGLFAADDRFAIKANVYSTTLWDITSYTNVGSITGYADHIDTEGLEIEASYATLSGYYVDFNANIANGDEVLPGGASIDWDGVPADGMQVTLGRRFGETLDLSWEMVADAGIESNGVRTPGFAVHNLRATWLLQEGALDGTSIRVGLENAFDREYTPHLSTRPAPGRNIKVALAKTF